MFTRRRFIKIACLFPLALRVEASEIKKHTVEIRDVLMGSFVQIKGIGIKKVVLEEIISYMKSLERHFSRFMNESELSQLNEKGIIKKPSREFREVMEMAVEAHSLTKGAFDITILPVLLHFEKYGKPLSEVERARYQKNVGIDRIRIYNDVIYTDGQIKITLDGIAKGYIIDMGVNRLMEYGCASTLVNVGGDMYCGEKETEWDVGIYDPFKDTISRKLHVKNTAVCTSGSYINYFSVDKKLHHIIDPKSLSSPNEMVSVTVTSNTVCRADMLSTALFVTGLEGKGFLKQGEHAHFITDKRKEILI